jgi:glyoxylate/hydroxypyruvate reductase
MKPALLVAARGWDNESWRSRFAALLPGRDILATGRNGIFGGPDEALANVRYALLWKPLQETLDRLTALQAIFSLGAGVDHIFALPRIPQVPIARIVDPDLTDRMSEYIVWQVLHHLRKGAAYRRQQAAHIWNEVDHPAAKQVTVGFMGFGIMGTAAADVLAKLGFKLRAWTRTPKTIEGIEAFSGADEVDAFLAGTDILVSLLPLTPETRGIINLDLIRKLRQKNPLGGSVIINAGRGGSQVEADIVQAFRERSLAGASLDVFEREPLPDDSPLWDFEDVMITPHVAAVSNPDGLAAGIAAQIVAFERGEPLRNCVDRARGY